MKVVTTGMPSRAGELGDLGLEPVAADLDVDHDHRPLRRGRAAP